jgi:hypothetical protein
MSEGGRYMNVTIKYDKETGTSEFTYKGIKVKTIYSQDKNDTLYNILKKRAEREIIKLSNNLQNK